MNCLLLFCLSGLYIEGGVGYVKSPPPVPAWAFEMYGPNAIRKYEETEVANPRGRVAIGHEWEPSRKFRISLELRHESWIGTNSDNGQDSVFISGRFKPFAN